MEGFGGGNFATCYLAEGVEEAAEVFADEVAADAVVEGGDGALEVAAGTEEDVVVACGGYDDGRGSDVGDGGCTEDFLFEFGDADALTGTYEEHGACPGFALLRTQQVGFVLNGE